MPRDELIGSLIAFHVMDRRVTCHPITFRHVFKESAPMLGRDHVPWQALGTIWDPNKPLILARLVLWVVWGFV